MQHHVHKHKLFEGVHLGLEDRELRRPYGGGLVDRAQHRGALGVYEVHERGVLAHHWRWKVHLRDGNFGHAGAVARRLGIPVPERLVGRARE